MPLTKTATAIIPVYNEEKTVKEMVQTVLKSKLFAQVIVVNDGSTDKSGKILKSFGKKIILINFSRNQGKSKALVAGVKKARSELVVFLDGDAVNLNKKHLLALVAPFKNKKTKVIIGYPKNVRKSLTFLMGERVYFRQDLLPYLKRMRICKFGIELFLEELGRKKKWQTKHVALVGLHKLLKFDKTGFTQKTLKGYLKEAWEIAEEAARIGQRTAEEKIAFQKKILQKILKNYLAQSRKMVEKILTKSKNLQKLKELLK